MTTYGPFKEIQMNMDMVDFQRSENLDNDYEIKSSLPLAFESEGYISPKFKGRLSVKLTNYTKKQIHLYEVVTVGYCILQPFALS